MTTTLQHTPVTAPRSAWLRLRLRGLLADRMRRMGRGGNPFRAVARALLRVRAVVRMIAQPALIPFATLVMRRAPLTRMGLGLAGGGGGSPGL